MNTTASVGVIVGRFQVPKLHSGHVQFVENVRKRHDEVLVVLGSSRAVLPAHSPLSADVRRVMLQNAFPGVVTAELLDCPSDQAWSERLDTLVSGIFPERSAVLYGSRGSFIPKYHGRFPVEEITSVYLESGAAVRKRANDTIIDSEEFRAGIIYAAMHKPSVVYPTVDIAVVRQEKREVLLGRKSSDGGAWRFIGGFVDPAKDASIEAAARRELDEETGMNLEVHRPFILLGTTRIDDPRYRATGDSIMTSFYRADYVFGSATASDDIEELRWFSYDEVGANLVETHFPLGAMFNKLIRDAK